MLQHFEFQFEKVYPGVFLKRFGKLLLPNSQANEVKHPRKLVVSVEDPEIVAVAERVLKYLSKRN